MAKVIYLNGPSSSGKTTIAHALQESLSDPYLHVGIDKMIGFMPAKLNNWQGGEAPLGFSWKKEDSPDGSLMYHIQRGPFAEKLTSSFKDIVKLLISQNYYLIIDDVAFGASEVETWKGTLKNCQVLYVGVTTSLEILEERERARGDRMQGSARSQYFKVHENAIYDLEVDTHSHSIEENVHKIRAALEAKFL